MIPIVAIAPFEGDLRSTLTKWKFRGHAASTRRLAEFFAKELSTKIDVDSVDVVTWAPTSTGRRRRRGYDQAELLARCVARRLRRPCCQLLIRRSCSSQTGRSRRDRIEDAPRFEARPCARPLSVLVVDDVVTTGSTLRAAGSALMKSGYPQVTLAALCFTPILGSAGRPSPEIRGSQH